MPTMSTYASDFGLMLTWCAIVEQLCTEEPSTTVVCDDPWLFRALTKLPVTVCSPVPSLFPLTLRYMLRGWLARLRAAYRVAIARYRLRKHRNVQSNGHNWLLVYGHPDSDAHGKDAYFGDLMTHMPNLRRIMHTDCPLAKAKSISAHSHTFSLHAFGQFRDIARMVFARWRPDTSMLSNKHKWLVTRSAHIEGRGASAAMTHWQMSCQRAWINKCNPKNVCWPWENHPWERDFSRLGKKYGVTTLGYQHTVVGRHMYNQSTTTNIGGLTSIPDRILLNGPLYRPDLVKRGLPEHQLLEMGSFRVSANTLFKFDKTGPVFVALSNNPVYAAQMIAALEPLANAKIPMIVKDHPLNPYPVSSSEFFQHTSMPIENVPPVRALVYCTGTTGLQGLLGGVPTIKFRPIGGIALDVLPRNIGVLSADKTSIKESLAQPTMPKTFSAEEMFPPPNIQDWAALFERNHETDQHDENANQ